jgi:hypothetical protein
VVDVLGTVSLDPSPGVEISFAARVTTVLDADLAINAKKAKIWTFDLKVRPAPFRALVNNVLVKSQDDGSSRLIQSIRRSQPVAEGLS